MFPECRFSGIEEETSIHILAECKALQNLRTRQLGAHWKEQKDLIKPTLADILKFITASGIKELLGFKYSPRKLSREQDKIDLLVLSES